MLYATGTAIEFTRAAAIRRSDAVSAALGFDGETDFHIRLAGKEAAPSGRSKQYCR